MKTRCPFTPAKFIVLVVFLGVAIPGAVVQITPASLVNKQQPHAATCNKKNMKITTNQMRVVMWFPDTCIHTVIPRPICQNTHLRQRYHPFPSFYVLVSRKLHAVMANKQAPLRERSLSQGEEFWEQNNLVQNALNSSHTVSPHKPKRHEMFTCASTAQQVFFYLHVILMYSNQCLTLGNWQ